MRFEAEGARGATPIAYGPMERGDVTAAARVYVESFPHRIRRDFRDPEHAESFYTDVFELMHLAYGSTCFAARHEGRLIGYLILTLPDTSLARVLWRSGFLFRAAGHALSGRFGLSPSLWRRAVSVVTLPSPPPADGPHVYVVVVAPGYRSQGVGTALLSRAKAACVPRFAHLWLYAEIDNHRAIALYERLGMRIVHSDAMQHAMVWEFQDFKMPDPKDTGGRK